MRFIKNNILVVALIGVFFGCNPLEDVYEELDKAAAAAGPDAGLNISYTLTSEDYGVLADYLRDNKTEMDSVNATYVDEYEALNSSIEIEDLLAEYVNENYPQLREGAAVRISYNYLTADGSDFSDYLNGESYTLSLSDYTSLAGSFPEPYTAFPGGFDAEMILPDLLASSVQDPLEDGVYFVSYTIAEELVVPDPVALFKRVEDEDVSAFTAIDITMESADYQLIVDYIQTTRGDDWIDDFGTFEYYFGVNSFFRNFDARIDDENNFSSTNRKNWIADNNLEDDIFDGSTNYTEDSTRVQARIMEGVSRFLSLKYGDARQGDNIVYNVEHTIFYNRLVEDGERFSRDTTISFIPSGELELESLTEDQRGVYYKYAGDEWSEIPSSEVIYFNSEDYNILGEENGQPGRFDNFSTDSKPSSYIPQYLSQLHPFAQEGLVQTVVFKFFDSNTRTTSTLAENYTFNGGAWTGSFFDTLTNQYVHTGEAFEFNPSVVLTMTASDYQLIVDEVKKTRPELLPFDNSEDLYGASAFFENFDIRLSNRIETDEDTGEPLQPEYIGLSEEESEALILERVTEGIVVFLEVKFSDVVPISGIDITYTVTYDTYDGTDGTGTEVFLLVGTGEFEPVVAE